MVSFYPAFLDDIALQAKHHLLTYHRRRWRPAAAASALRRAAG